MAQCPDSGGKLGCVIGDILQPTHLIFVLVVALLVLGPKRLPEVGRSLGRGLRDFRAAVSSADPREELNEHTVETTPAPTRPAQPASLAQPAAVAAAPPPAPPAPPASGPAEHSG